MGTVDTETHNLSEYLMRERKRETVDCLVLNGASIAAIPMLRELMEEGLEGV